MLKLFTKVLIIGLFLHISAIMIKSSLCGMTADEIQTLAGVEHAHALSISNSIYKKKIDDILLFPGIPGRIKGKLNNKFYTGIYKPSASEISCDGTNKYLFRNKQGLEFETVYLRDEKRNTVCVSSQSGCRMGCPFCATGKYGFRGNLPVQDILNQIISLPGSDKITHVVFMGMGEPMDNIENVLKACGIISAEWGLAISQRNITVSTVGITTGIIRFLDGSACNLALSLYSPFPEERYLAVPAEKKYPAHKIIDIMKDYGAAGKRRMSIAYIMIGGINDTDRHLEGLKRLVNKSRIRINLLPYHQVYGDDCISSSPERMQYFKHELVVSGISASIRKSRGADVSAACGLLASGLRQ
jgi:23S rRNA (adenine2503-C2)-methyltransferase